MKLLGSLSIAIVLATVPACKRTGETSSSTEAPTRQYPDSADGLKQLAQDLTAAAPDQATAMSEDLALPDAAGWFDKTFGAELGARLAAAYGKEAASLRELPKFFTTQQSQGKTEMSAIRIDNPYAGAANGVQGEAQRQMKTLVPLFTLELKKPGEERGTTLWSFVHFDGKFRYVGKLKGVKPDASPLDFLAAEDVAALRGK
jgi:hypothetical protein